MSELDLMKAIREGQLALAHRLADEIFPVVEFLSLKLAGTAAATTGMDPEMTSVYLKSELEHDLLLALHGCTDWYASEIVRGNDFSRRRLALAPHEIVRISEKYDVPAAAVAFVGGRMAATEGVLPLLGRVSGGILRPDKRGLKEWKKLFDRSPRPMGP